jgi:hypothetical protein
MAVKPDLNKYEVVSEFVPIKLNTNDDKYEVVSTLVPIKSNTDDDQLQDKQEIPVTVEMITWNLSGSKLKNKSGLGFADIRYAVVSIVKETTKKCITFMQEITINADGLRKKCGYDGKCTIAMPIGSKTREAAVVTPPKGKGLQYVTGEILNDPVLETKGVKDIFTKRMCGQQVTLKKMIGESEYTASITLVSYHARYRVPNKKEIMLEYFNEMCNLADTLKQTIIIGGDFNLPVLDWKKEVEASFKDKEEKDRVCVALYVGTPRRNGYKLIDTFAVVQPSDPEYQTEATFEETMGIYQFPLAGHVGGVQFTDLRDYPSDSPENRWFKYVHFNNADLKMIEDELKTKDKKDLKKCYEQAAQKIGCEEGINGMGKSIDQLEEEIKDLECGAHLLKCPSNPFEPLCTLWPYSCLHQVMDHDAVLTKIKITLKRNDSAQDNTPTAPEKRVTRSTKIN